MRSFWFTARIALLFGVVMAVVLLGSLALFGRVSGHGLLREVGRLRAYEGSAVAEQIEAELGSISLHGPEVRALLDEASLPWDTQMSLVAVDAPPPMVAKHHEVKEHEVVIRGRSCRIYGPPVFETRVPIRDHGRTVALLSVRGPLHDPEAHGEFLLGILEIGAVALAGVIVLAVVLTVPLRRMARSMDRIAAGELDHRVAVKGRDEVARVGASFNAMADRIEGMIVGQKELMAGVSHELRSPLTRIKLSLELWRRNAAEGGRVDEVEAEVDALDAMVEEILVASRLELGQTTLVRERVDLEEVVRHAWRRMGEVAPDAAGLGLELDLDDDARQVHADRALVQRVFGNLFENSRRYAGAGAVRVSSRRCDAAVEVTVADAGPGVAEEHLEHLFEPFFRVDASRSRKTGASGLGLMIVRRAVEAHGGAVRAERAAAGGLRVVLTLPSPIAD